MNDDGFVSEVGWATQAMKRQHVDHAALKLADPINASFEPVPS
jgi:hypothetical protein